MTDIPDDEQMDGDFTACWEFMQVIYCSFSPLLPGNFDRFLADGDGVNDGLPDGLTDESDEVQIEGNFPGIGTFRKFGPGILMGIFTMNLADGWTGGMDDRCTHRQTNFQVESHFG